MRVLVVEDEVNLLTIIKKRLQREYYSVDACADGKEALDFAEVTAYDAVILDIMLPGISGLEVLRKLRAEGNPVPVLLLTAKDSIEDRVRGLDLGADDYITKPFGTDELMARIRTALRHHDKVKAGNSSEKYQVEGLEIDFGKRLVMLEGQSIHLTQIEYKLITLLAKNAGKVLTYDHIMKEIWGPYAGDDNQILRVNMANIRRKLEKNPAEPKYIFTEVGVGYRMQEDR